MVTTIVLVRHATTDATGKRLGGWTPDVHLNEAGVAEAEATAQALEHVRLAAVYASPLERAQETAQIIARTQRLRVRTRKAFGEVDLGAWTDLPLGQARRRALWKVIQTTPSRAAFPGGESLRAMQTRAVDAVERLAREHVDEAIAVVSHADPLKAVVAHYLGMPLDTFQRLVIAPASITMLHLQDGTAPRLGCINHTVTGQGRRP